MSGQSKDKEKQDLLLTLSPPILATSNSVNRKLSKKIEEDQLAHEPSMLKGLIKTCHLIGVSGGDCSGKKVLMRAMAKELANHNVKMAVLQQESFFKQKSQEPLDSSAKKMNIYNPQNTDWVEFQKALLSLVVGNQISISKYDFQKQQLTESFVIQPSLMVLVTGLHIFSNKTVRELADVLIFVEADADVRLSRRVYQDTVMRGISLDESIKNYLDNIKPAFEKYTEPTKSYADMAIPHFGGGYASNSDSIEGGGFESQQNKAAAFLVFQALREIEDNKKKQQANFSKKKSNDQ